MPRARHVRPVLALAALGLVLAGCGTQRAGSAAVVGDERLPETQLAAWAQELDDLYAANPDAQRPPDDQLSLALTSWWLNEQLTAVLAEQQGVTASPSDVDQLLGTDPAQHESISVQNSIPPSQLEAAAEYVVLRRSLGAALAPGATSDQADAAYLAALQQTAADLAVVVSPRFGVWNPDVPGLEPRAVERLSRPETTTTEPPPAHPEQ